MSDSKTTADRLARAHTAEAFAWILDVGRSTAAKDTDRLRAAQLILEMGHGKPTQAVIAIPSRGAGAQRVAQYTTEKIMEMIEQRGGMQAMLERNAIEADFTELKALPSPEPAEESTQPDDGSDLI